MKPFNQREKNEQQSYKQNTYLEMMLTDMEKNMTSMDMKVTNIYGDKKGKYEKERNKNQIWVRIW
jgi:pantothenate kinase